MASSQSSNFQVLLRRDTKKDYINFESAPKAAEFISKSLKDSTVTGIEFYEKDGRIWRSRAVYADGREVY